MTSRLGLWWGEVQSSLWFIPTLPTLAAVLLAFASIRADEVLLASGVNWVFGEGVEGARGVLSSIAGGIITVTRVVFFVTVVRSKDAGGQAA